MQWYLCAGQECCKSVKGILKLDEKLTAFDVLQWQASDFMLVPSRSKQSRGRMCQLNGGSIYLCLALYSELEELLIGGIYT